MGRYCTIVKSLKGAREIVERGWVKNTLYDGNGNYCLVGAVRRCSGTVEWSSDLPMDYHEVFYNSGAIPERYDTDPYCRAFRFNDNMGTRKEDVLQAIDVATAYACERAMEEEKQAELTLGAVTQEKADG